MLIETFKSVSTGFIVAEQQILLRNIVGYAEQVGNTIKGDGPIRMTGNVYLTLESNFHSGAALGFLITLQLLRRWAEERGDNTWLIPQYANVDAMGSEAIGEYVVPFLEDPTPEMKRLSELLTNKSPLRGFIQYGEIQWSPFSVGAYLVLGLLLHSEPTVRTLVE